MDVPNADSDAKPITAREVLIAPLRGLWEMIVAPGRCAGRLQQVAFLRSLDDMQLAERGLIREGILRHVYGGPLYHGPIRHEAGGRGNRHREMTAG